jgi:GrpB-like predicted nucleotidyltransferase (UPF0157 family)
VTVIGQYKRDLRLVPYQSGWPKLFEQEAQRLQGALGEKALRIEHVGSTSIPGLAAKPIIDIMIAVPSLVQGRQMSPLLEALGYQYKPLDAIPERIFFARESKPEHRTHHLSLAEPGSGYWRKQLAFRDYLRAHADTAAEYVVLKQDLAEEYARTQQLDREWKTEFVVKVLQLAEQEGLLK